MQVKKYFLANKHIIIHNHKNALKYYLSIYHNYTLLQSFFMQFIILNSKCFHITLASRRNAKQHLRYKGMFCFSDTMMKFPSFETIVDMMYKHAIPTPKEQCSQNFQLGVSFAGGYLAGLLYSVVSHPANNLVSFLNNVQGATVGDVSILLYHYISLL